MGPATTSPEDESRPPPYCCGKEYEDAREDGEQFAASEYNGGMPTLDVVGS